MLGDGAMIKMAQSKVLLSGLGGLGIEIGRTSQIFLQMLWFNYETVLVDMNVKCNALYYENEIMHRKCCSYFFVAYIVIETIYLLNHNKQQQ